MSASLIKFSVLNNLKETKTTRWKTNKSSETLNDLKIEGLRRLKMDIESNVRFKFYELQPGNKIELGDEEDEVTELGYDYIIIDERIVKQTSKRFL